MSLTAATAMRRLASRALSLSVGLFAGVHATPCWAEEPLAAAPRSTLVHVDSGRSVRLERRNATDDPWVPVCDSPCDSRVSIDATYRIAGDGVRTSAPFTLEPMAGNRLSIDVATGAKAGFAVGVVLTSVSPLVLLVGAGIYLLASGADIDRSLKPVGLGLTAGGVAGLVTGIVLIALNARTTQSQTAQAPVRGAVGAARLPTWNDLGWVPVAPSQLNLAVVTF